MDLMDRWQIAPPGWDPYWLASGTALDGWVWVCPGCHGWQVEVREPDDEMHGVRHAIEAAARAHRSACGPFALLAGLATAPT